MGFVYLVSFLDDDPKQPRGIAMYDRELMVAWDWLDRQWRSAPDLVAPMLFRQLEVTEISRDQAETIAAHLDIPPIPSEDEARAICNAAVNAKQAPGEARGS